MKEKSEKYQNDFFQILILSRYFYHFYNQK